MKNYITILFAVTMTAMLTLAENAMAQAKTQAELKEYAASLFSSISLDPQDIVVSDSLKKRNLSIEIRGKNYTELAKAHKGKDWLKMISLLDRDGKQYTEYPEADTIDSAFQHILNAAEFQVLVKGNFDKLLSSETRFRETDVFELRRIGCISLRNLTTFHDFESFLRRSIMPVPSSNGFRADSFASFSNHWEKHPDGIGYYMSWKPSRKPQCLIVLSEQGQNKTPWNAWREKMTEVVEYQQKKIKLGELTQEQAAEEMRKLYEQAIAETIKWCRNQ